MTVTADQYLAGSGLNDLVARTELLLAQRRRLAGWWVELVACLDALSARAAGVRSGEGERDSLAEQIRLDAPHLYGSLRRLDEESEALSAKIVEVRISAGSSAGDDSNYIWVSREVRSVLRRLRKLESRSNSVVLDAYDRDIGGE
jgi:hypothetical protein